MRAGFVLLILADLFLPDNYLAYWVSFFVL
jgi:hypothetical protein